MTFEPNLTANTCASLFVQAYKSDLTSNNEVLPIRGVWSSIESLCICCVWRHLRDGLRSRQLSRPFSTTVSRLSGRLCGTTKGAAVLEDHVQDGVFPKMLKVLRWKGCAALRLWHCRIRGFCSVSCSTDKRFTKYCVHAVSWVESLELESFL